MDIKLIEEKIKKDMAERKSPDYYKWTDIYGGEHDMFNYTTGIYFLESMMVHITRAGKKPSETLESDLRNAYNCGICVLIKLKEIERYPDLLAAIDANNELFIDFYKNAYTTSVQCMIDGTWEYITTTKSCMEYYAYTLQFLIWYNIHKESE